MSFPGGSELLTEWYDPQLETACEFQITSDGEYRCMPSAPLFEPVYSASDCSTASALVATTESPCEGEAPRYAITKKTVDDCSLGPSVYALEISEGQEYSGPVYYKEATGACLVTEVPPEFQFYRAREMAPDEMVAAERKLEGHARVQRYRFSAEDGASEASTLFFDQDLGEDCFFYTATDGQRRCIPGDYFLYPQGGGVFGDSACSAPVKVLDECKDTDLAYTLDPSSCEYRLVSYQLGLLATWAYVSTGQNQCTPVSEELLAGHTVRLLEEQLAPTDLVATVDVERRGEGRIQAEYQHLDDGTEIFAGWWDTERDVSCTPTAMADGAIHCLPYSRAGANLSSYFGDPDCQENVGVAVLNEACAEEDITYTSEGECGGLHAYDLAPVTKPLFTLDAQTSECSPVGSDVLARLHQIEGEADPASFEAGSINGDAAALRVRPPSPDVAGRVQPLGPRPPARRDFRPF